MDYNGKRMAGGLTIVLTVVKWVLVTALALLIPAMVIFFFDQDGARLQMLREGAGTVTRISPLAEAWFLVFANLTMACALVCVTRLRAVLGTVATGEPFAAANADRLRWIAGGMAGVALTSTILPWIMPGTVRNALDLDRMHLHGGQWIGVFVVLVLAEVFREGARLRADVEGTI